MIAESKYGAQERRRRTVSVHHLPDATAKHRLSSTHQNLVGDLPLLDGLVVSGGEDVVSVGIEGDAADEARMSRHRPDALLQRQVPKPDLTVARTRRHRRQVGRVLQCREEWGREGERREEEKRREEKKRGKEREEGKMND